MNNVDTLRGDLAVSSSSIRRVALVAAAFSVAASIPMTASADTYTDGNGIEWTYTVLDETADPVMEMIVRVVQILDGAYPRIMKAIWS